MSDRKQYCNGAIAALTELAGMLADPLHVEMIERAAARRIRSDETVQAVLAEVTNRIASLRAGYTEVRDAPQQLTLPDTVSRFVAGPTSRHGQTGRSGQRIAEFSVVDTLDGAEVYVVLDDITRAEHAAARADKFAADMNTAVTRPGQATATAEAHPGIRQFTASDVSRWTGIPLSLLKGPDK